MTETERELVKRGMVPGPGLAAFAASTDAAMADREAGLIDQSMAVLLIVAAAERYATAQAQAWRTQKCVAKWSMPSLGTAMCGQPCEYLTAEQSGGYTGWYHVNREIIHHAVPESMI